MVTPLRILYIEDVDNDATLIAAHLRRAGYATVIERVETAAAMTAALAAAQWDLVLSDFSMPHFSAPDALRILHASGQDLPFIIVSGTIQEEQAVTALRAGAHDFIVKDRLARLVPAVTRELREAEIRAAHRREQAVRQELETGFQLLFANSPLPMWLFDPDTLQFVEVNEVAVATYGYSRAEFLQMRVSDLQPAEDRPALDQALPEADEPVQPPQLPAVWRHRWKDGRLREVEIAAHSLEINGRRLTLAVVHDVTRERQYQAEIQHKLEQLAALRAIDQAISGSLDLSLTLSVFLAQVVTQLGVDAADVLLLNPRDQMLEFAAGQGFRTSEFQAVRQPVGEGRAGQAVKERRIVVSGPSRGHPASMRTGLLGGEDFACYYGVPLIAKDQVLGALEIFHRLPLEPTPEWLEFLEALAGEAAIALENAALFSSLQRSNTELQQAYDATIQGWSRALDLRDRETEGHSQRVTELTERLARAMGLPEKLMLPLRRGSLLHDIGKMGVPDHILFKPGPLTDDEWTIMRQHPNYAYGMLSPINYLRPALDIPYCHHEKWDGSGYPRQLKGEAIPLSARIFAVVDVWDALRSDRPYRLRWPAQTVLGYIRDQAGKHFDPQVVAAFLEMQARTVSP